MQYLPLQKKLCVAAASLALLSAAACSSRNPDALTGMNVDENLAMMNADENVATDDTAANTSTNDQAAAPSSNQAASAKPQKEAATSDDEEANATETDQIIQPDEPMTGNQSDGNEDEPNDQY